MFRRRANEPCRSASPSGPDGRRPLHARLSPRRKARLADMDVMYQRQIFHDLRDALAVGQHGADVQAVAEVMGHADPTMLLRVYQHSRYRLRKKAVNAAPGLGIKIKKNE